MTTSVSLKKGSISILLKSAKQNFTFCVMLSLFVFPDFIVPVVLNAQDKPYGTITGTLVDSNTLEPLPSAHIYLSNTTLGTSSNPDGTFVLGNIPPGNYDLVFQFIGFELIGRSVQIRENDLVELGKITMSPQVHELGSIDVDAQRPRDWLRNLDHFKIAFIGRSKNAEKTTIKNPEILEFNRDRRSGLLHAEAVEELHIENRSLGYEMFITLISFSWNTDLDGGEYFSTIRFVEMEPENEQQKEEWEENRKITYAGSFRHFLQSLVAGTNDLEFRFLNGSIEAADENIEGEDPASQLFYSSLDSGQTVYHMEIHNRNRPFAIRYKNRHRSEIEGLYDNTLLVDRFGNLLNPENITFSGHWSRYRMSDFLPYNYEGYELINSSNSGLN